MVDKSRSTSIDIRGISFRFCDGGKYVNIDLMKFFYNTTSCKI